jgi:hypothetical protein
VIAGFALAIALPTAVEAAQTGSQTFTSTRGEQTFTVPAAVNAPPTPSTPATGTAPTARMDTAWGLGLISGGPTFVTVAAACRRRRAPV